MADDRIGTALAALDGWLESSRSDTGYTGPVAHWWRDCLLDCRAGFDWRYEGIVAGYLALWTATGEARWLDRAMRAGDDLVAAQQEDGHFRRSRFELNPGTGGTPHEAAADTALLRLALALWDGRPDRARRFLAAAQRNVDRCLIGRLWDAESRSFRDDPARPSFVPNKACTTIEALLLLADATGDERYAAIYALPTAEAVLRHQVRRPGSHLDGAIAQNSFDGPAIPRFLSYYVARCMPGLLALRRHDPSGRFAEAALAAGAFVARCQESDGGLPQVLYDDGRRNRSPRWVAAAGDVLRAWRMLEPLGLRVDRAATEHWLMDGQLPHGGFMTARGFAGQGDERESLLPDFRDFLGVGGWTDKAFRWLAESRAAGIGALPADPGDRAFEADCQFLGHRLVFRADRRGIELRERHNVVYRWRSGAAWPDVVAPWLAVR